MEESASEEEALDHDHPGACPPHPTVHCSCSSEVLFKSLKIIANFNNHRSEVVWDDLGPAGNVTEKLEFRQNDLYQLLDSSKDKFCGGLDTGQGSDVHCTRGYQQHYQHLHTEII